MSMEAVDSQSESHKSSKPKGYEISEDPMKNLQGESAKQLIKMLKSTSEKNEISVLKDAVFESNTVKFKLKLDKK